MNSEYLFVGEDLELHKGEDARIRLADVNDKQFLEDGKGVVRVPKSRWNVAQTYEQRTWLDAGAHAADDRNEEHALEFDNYQVLSGKTYPRAIELGCGPFTNLRILAKRLDIKSCVLLDPLINSYRGHRNCTYLHGKVKTSDSNLGSMLGKSLVGRAVRKLVRHLWPANLKKGFP